MITPGHAYTWASPRAPSILIQSLFRNDTALKFRFRLDPELWSWSLKFLRECTASRAAANTAHKVRLSLLAVALR
jgi:D-amino-acid dehydrogenase